MHQAERISGDVTCPRMGDASTDCTIRWNASACMAPCMHMLAACACSALAGHTRSSQLAGPTIGGAKERNKDRRQRHKMTWPTPQCSPHRLSKLCACELVNAVSEECMSERCVIEGGLTQRRWVETNVSCHKSVDPEDLVAMGARRSKRDATQS
jgi:hypothetical protein